MSTDPFTDPHNPFHDSVDWKLRQHTPVRRMLNFFERVSLALEIPIVKFVRRPEFNPLYHTGTITTFLLLVILVTGAYLTFFYQFGFESSYAAVAKIEANFVGRIIRAVHRYASGAAVITALLHAWRTFFQDRFRGPRWLAWVSGIVMALVVWFIGITGYWLIWDERAQILNLTLFKILENSKLGIAFLLKTLISDAATTGWVFMVIVITAHLGLSAVVGLFYWLHLKRLRRPKLLPPKFWMWILGGLLTVFGLLIPVGMLPPASFERLAAEFPVDLFFLFYLPAALKVSPWILWGGVVVLSVALSAIPWLLIRQPLLPIQVNADRCTGCILCEVDCPYRAITMIDRADDNKFKQIAEIDPNLCVACGVCIGSCDPLALTLGTQPAEALWDIPIVEAKSVVFTCERHLAQNFPKVLNLREVGTQVIPVTCVGMLHPKLLAQTWEAGAAGVQVIGCPPEDCATREGNLHLQQRLDGDRKPILRSKYKAAPISTDWLAPTDFKSGLRTKIHRWRATAYDFVVDKSNWRSLIPATILLAVVIGLQVALTAVPYRPVVAEQAGIEIVLNHRAGYPLQGVVTSLEPSPNSQMDTRIILVMDDQILVDETSSPRGAESRAQVFERVAIMPGNHAIQLKMFDRTDGNQSQIIFDDVVDLPAGQILRLNFADGSVGSDPAEGEKLYYETSLGTNASCRICHTLELGDDGVGPSFGGIAPRAAERIPGMSAEEYLRQSILDPDAFVVDGYPSGLMVPNLDETLTETQIEDLIAFLMTLE
jgi:ferredoxin/coenzyme F420-reducing hydrogenase delta subunit